MYKVVAVKDILSTVTQQHKCTHTPKVSKRTSELRIRRWSNFQPHFGYVSIDYVIPYSIAVSLELDTFISI